MALSFADQIAFYETGDGSLTLINKVNNQTYHSKNGAVQESLHVFIAMGLEHVLQNGGRPLNILEVGFGTGLNALLTADSNYIKPFLYHAIEPFLVPVEMLMHINYTQFLKQKHLKDYFISQYQREVAAENDPIRLYLGNCEVVVFNTTFEKFKPNALYDLIYYDAFSYTAQQELWEPAALLKAVSLLKPGGVFVTYSITGKLKRSLKEAGMQIEKAEGARGKREMLRATKPLTP